MNSLGDADRREYELLRTVARFEVLYRDEETGDWFIPTGLEGVPRWVIVAEQVRSGIERGYLEVDEGSEPSRLQLTPTGRTRLRELEARRRTATMREDDESRG